MKKFTVGLGQVNGLNGQVVLMRNRAGRTWFYNQKAIHTFQDVTRMKEFAGQISELVNAGEKINAIYWTEVKAA